MEALRHALIADGSKICLQLLSILLRPLIPSIRTTASLEGVMLELDAEPTIDILLVDMDLPGGGARAVLRRLEEIEGPRPLVIVLGRGVFSEETQASLDGAAGYLGMPLSPGAIARLFWHLGHPHARGGSERVDYRSPITATVLDEAGYTVIECEVRNLSRSGALLLSQGPLDVGTELRLQLRRERQPCELRATVVRVQEPRWGVLPGVAVAFPEGDLGPEADEFFEPET